jgi:hypothetical protein
MEAKVAIPIFLLNEAQDGVLKVHVPHGACCPEHSFMAFIDKKFMVRGYQNADIEFTTKSESDLEAPATMKKEQGLKEFTVTEMLDTVGLDIAATMLRTILIGRPILLMDTFDLYDRVDKMVALLHDLESEDLVITAEKVTRDELKEDRVKRANALVLAPLYKAIVKSPFATNIKTRFESDLLMETTMQEDRTSQILFLRKELLKITKIIDEFVKELKKVEKIYEEDIPAFTMSKFNYKIDSKNIDVIKEIIEFRYDKKLAQKIINKSLDKIRTDLW